MVFIAVSLTVAYVSSMMTDRLIAASISHSIVDTSKLNYYLQMTLHRLVILENRSDGEKTAAGITNNVGGPTWYYYWSTDRLNIRTIDHSRVSTIGRLSS